MVRRFSGHIQKFKMYPNIFPHIFSPSWAVFEPHLLDPQTLPETNCETCAVRGPTLWPRLPSNNFWSAVHFGTSDASFPQLPETPFVSVSLILLITKTYKSPMLWPHGKGLLL